MNVVDQLTGGHLEFNSVFGYSATVGIRFSGIGNQSSALLATAAVLVAAFVAWRFRTTVGHADRPRSAGRVLRGDHPAVVRAGLRWHPRRRAGFALLAWLLLGRRVTVKAVLAMVGILLASGLVVGFLDLLRPHDQRTHVGRFFEKVGNEGFSGFSSVIERKSGENAATFSSTIYLVLIVVVLIAGVLLWLRPPRPLVAAVARCPTLRPAAISLAVLILLSYALNDSGTLHPRDHACARHRRDDVPALRIQRRATHRGATSPSSTTDAAQIDSITHVLRPPRAEDDRVARFVPIVRTFAPVPPLQRRRRGGAGCTPPS